MDLGMHTTLADANSKLDPEVIAIASKITPLMANEFGRIWDLFTNRAVPFITDEFEVLVRNYTQPQVIVTASGAGADWDTNNDITGLPVDATYIDRITVGDVLLVQNEVVVVKAVDRTANTIDVYERGAGESANVAHGVAPITAKVVGNAHEEGKVDAEAMAEGTTKFTNYTQLVEEIIDLSKADSDQARKTGRTTDTLREEAIERIMRDLARTAIYGVAVAPASGKPSMTRGLLQWLGLTAGIKTNVAGAFTEIALKSILKDVRLAGGTVNFIAMSPNNKTVFNGFSSADSITVDNAVRYTGRVIDAYMADGFGIIPVIVDLDMPNDQIVVGDSRKLEKGWKENDTLRFVKETNTSSRENKETLQGKFALAVQNVGQSFGLLTGLTTA
jgi:hypothetical protein